MAVNKARILAGILGANSLVSPDSDFINTSYDKGVAVSSGTMSVYSSIDSLPVSAIAGTKALVTSTNTLYIYSGGWYKIAIINNFNPQWITQPNGTYDLAVNGTATSITVLASDSDDVPITYIATPDSDFLTFATVTHDSDKDNTWIIQPVDSENGAAVGGSGTITFKASDGINLVSAVSTFSLSFGASYSNLLDSEYDFGTYKLTYETSGALHGSHSAYVQLPASDQNNGTSTSRSPGGGSAPFPASITYNDYTISLWVKVASFNSTYGITYPFNTNDKSSAGNSYGSCALLLSSSENKIEFCTNSYTSSAYSGISVNVGSGAITTGVWYHIVASGSTTGTPKLWVTTQGSAFGNLANASGYSNISAVGFTGTVTQPLKFVTSDTWYLHGSIGNAGNSGINSYYDDLRIYNTQLNSTQAEAIYDAAGDVTLDTNPAQDNMVLQYGFDNTNLNYQG